MTTEFQTLSLKESRRPQHFNVMCFASFKNVMVFCDSSYNGIFDETNIDHDDMKKSRLEYINITEMLSSL